jgi:PAS domain-containing protein
MRRSTQPGEAGVSEHVADSTVPTPVGDAFSSGMVALERSPAALALATLAGDLLYLNANGERLFGVAHGAALTGRNLADICSDAGQPGVLEAVARDARGRNLLIRVESASTDPRGETPNALPTCFLCKLTRIDGYGGIPTWLAFAGIERDDSATDDASPLSDAESLAIIRRLSNVAAWKMPLDTQDIWTQNMMQWDPGMQALLNLKSTHSKVVAQQFLEYVAREDRELAGNMVEQSLGGARFEAVLRMNPRNGSPKIVLTRAVLDTDAQGASEPTLLGTVQDITSALGNEMRPYEKAAILDTIAANLEAPVYAVDRDLRYTYFNSFFAFMLRRVYGVDAMLGEKAYEAVSDDVRRRVVLGHLRRALGGARVVEEVPVSVDDAIVRRYELTYSPIRSGAATGGVTVFGIRSPGAVTSR